MKSYQSIAVKRLLLPFFCFASGTVFAQPLSSHQEQIAEAKDILRPAFQDFGTCVVKGPLDKCVSDLVQKAPDPYRRYIAAGLLYTIDMAASYHLHQQAYLSQPDDADLLREYAIELHRRGQYEPAAKLYERYQADHKYEIAVNVWLADCYIQMGQTEKAMAEWAKANHPNNQTGIDRHINTIHGKTDQMMQRDTYRKDLTQGNKKAAAPLIALDANWKIDPWTQVVEEDFLTADLELAMQKMDSTRDTYKKLQAYVAIKRLPNVRSAPWRDSVKIILKKANLILDGKPLPDHGAIAAELIRLAILSGSLSDKEFYAARGAEILQQAKAKKDAELLSIYTTLQTKAKGTADPAIDKMGWKEFKDERFAVSYFMGKGENNRYNDPELAQALADFPGSAMLYWVKINCGKLEGKPLRPLIIELIKSEFKTLASDPNHSSFQLNAYFGYLTTEK